MREFSGLVLFEPTMFPVRAVSGRPHEEPAANQTLLTAFARRAFVTFRDRSTHGESSKRRACSRRTAHCARALGVGE